MEMTLERFHDENWKRHGPSTGLTLGRREDPTLPGYFVDLPHDRNRSVQWIDVAPFQPEEFPEAQTAKASQEDQTAEPQLNGIGQLEDLSRLDHGALRRMLNAGPSDGARIPSD
jgi:hypothetical protein